MKELIILIPHYNNVEGLYNSIRSIEESFKIDLMVVDDGSETKPSIIDLKKNYKLGEIIFEALPVNQGIESVLNYGLKKILDLNYNYIGRLDCGDLCHKNKFLVQLNYLSQNQDIVLLGTQVNFIGSKNKKILYKSNLPTSYKKIKKEFYVNCVIIHPTVVFRSNILNTTGFYPTAYKAAEDYAFFFKILKKYKVENLNEVLVDVIFDEKGISFKSRKTQIRSKIKIIKDNFYIGLYPIYGILRNSLLLYMPHNLLISIKKSFFKK